MELNIVYGEEVSSDFLRNIVPINEACYEPHLRHKLENIVSRFEKNKRSFVFVKDSKTDEVIAYINFFPCTESLYEDNLGKAHAMRDDDIKPEEIADYSKVENHIFILSLAILPKYQDTDVIDVITEAFVAYLMKLESEGFPITDIMAVAVSFAGQKKLGRWGFQKFRGLDKGNVLYVCDEARLDKFLSRNLF